MSEREELEAEIKAIEGAGLLLALQTPENRRRHLATALLSSGYTKGNGELVEAVRGLVDAADTFASMRVCWSTKLREAGEPISSMKEIAINYSSVFEIGAAIESVRKALSDSEGVATSGRSGGDDAGRYLLLKRALYWRPNSAGYTPLKSEAGRYSFEEASARATPRDIRDKYEGPHVYMIAEDRADQLAERCKHVDFTEPTPPAQDTNGGRDDAN